MFFRTEPRRRNGPRPALSGVTLLELMLVLGLLTLLLVLVTPTFLNMLQGERERETTRLTRMLRVVRNEAVLTGRRQRVWFDLKANAYEFEQEVDGFFEVYERPRMMRPHPLPEGLRMVDLMTVGENSERIRDRRVPILIDHSGYMDPFLLHLHQGTEPFTVRADGLSGRIEVLSGDVTEMRETR
ncbi:MAG: hypothetical protein HY342_12465 [Candidatus Lambdaproteobacteria bacterium]|nr:hypothetical protein [Candidatus Lambdaproteobacteria bacterium]